MSFQASIHDLTTGCFLLRCNVEARDLHEAENAAITKAARTMRTLAREMDVRHLHQCASHPPECGFAPQVATAAQSGAK